MSQTDKADLAHRYQQLHSDEHRQRWSLDNEGNRAALAERLAVMSRLAAGRLTTATRILDLGCGGMSALPSDVSVESLIGVDLLMDRLLDLRHGGVSTPTVNADGAFLPFADGSFDAVVMSTMLSSVLAEPARQAICAEVTRVLAKGGAVLWYDFRVPSPSSDTRPVRRPALRKYFPQMTGRIESLTVLPPLARRLGRAARTYPLLGRLPFLRTHLAACLIKHS
jgi:ubiquinone/menaquinone biosynthesis C-methylase UbiE